MENFLKIQCEHWYNVQLSFEVDVSYTVKDETENEAAFRDTSETCNAHVAYWSLGQTAILLVSGVWQIMHLKRFFEAKKLV